MYTLPIKRRGLISYLLNQEIKWNIGQLLKKVANGGSDG